MNWLLITAIHDNPGDAFVRVGVQRIIRHIDPAATFRLLCKQTSAMGEPQPFDRAVWCGMPVFWDAGHDNRCWRIGWWGGLVGQHDAAWIAAEPRRFLVAGAGSFTRWPGASGVHDPDGLRAAAADVLDHCHRLYARDPVVAEITGQAIDHHPCPAVFAVADQTPLMPGVSVCNLMPDGGHYAEYGPEQARAWRQKLIPAARILREAGFVFAAHTEGEHGLARELGWRRDRIVTDSRDPAHLLSLYAGCARYFGNRIHGAIAARGAGADAWSVGYDSRQTAVEMCGGRATAPADLDLDELEAWAAADPRPVRFDWAREFKRQAAIFRRFAA